MRPIRFEEADPPWFEPTNDRIATFLDGTFGRTGRAHDVERMTDR